MQDLTAEGTLQRAQHFLGRAAQSATTDPVSMRFDLEAAIVFARSVTFHLQKELCAQSGFCEWYSTVQEQLGSDPVARFLVQTRNFILKEGPPAVRKQIVVVVNEAVELDEALHVTVKRGSPWYGRSSRILFEDLFRPIKRWMARRNYEREQAARRFECRVTSKTAASTTRVVFATPPIENQSVFDVIGAHLASLETIVKEARERFAPQDPQ